MPEIKCEYGHTLRIGTDEWVNQLSLDQLRYARQQMAEKIDQAEQGPRRTPPIPAGPVHRRYAADPHR
ncbi:hypothetical protein PS943_05862 [Pseudomonas fluorescens]|uniref:Uncharacterized protein n=1 Tax=Pseudomonas fluorescens TaxID=294 RepID=A0A5E7WSE5_PSEFL|nr:hypothetical protein [Pseudomonas fluorescens]VVQ38419.1 hypothetical protein PS943_05862 [Pseudomonas fluorescens]